MKVKSLCLVCRGAKQVIDKNTQMLRTCVACEGEGWIMVKQVHAARYNVLPKPEPKEVAPKPKLKRKLQKEQTHARILQAVKKYQEKYLQAKNLDDLVPMRLKDIGEIAGCSPSTVYLYMRDTEIDEIPVMSLFSPDVNGHSGRKVMDMIKNIVKCEPRPLSDGEIHRIMGSSGVKISRRTVSLYRNLLKIPCAAERIYETK